MLHDPTLPLEFITDNNRVGFRLKRLEVFNWGTFHQRIWKYEVDGRNSLLTGDIGTGKSTLVDAITTLLVPAKSTAYNKAGGSTARERSLKSYFLGHYKGERNEVTGSSKPVSLRDESSYSVILGVFHNEGTDQSITLAQVFWMRDSSSNPARLFVASERELCIADNFSDFGGTIVALRKKLRSSDCELFDNYPAYGAWFRRRFCIEHEQALELFLQTVSMKSVENLTVFVRGHMLEPFDVGSRIAALMSHYNDLDRAHQTVLKVKRQVEMLVPIAEEGEQHKALSNRIQAWREGQEQLRPYFARLKSGLLAQRLSLLTDDAVKLDARVEGLAGQLEIENEEVRSLERAMRENGGDRLDELATEIRRHEKEKGQRQLRFEHLQQLLGNIHESMPDNENRFIDLQMSIAKRVDGLRERNAKLDNDKSEVDFEVRNDRETYANLSKEIESLQRRKSNIDDSHIRIRNALCKTLSTSEDELPFAGELIQVREDEQDWEGAAERLLRSFGLSLLVPEHQYKSVMQWVDRQHLGTRLLYFHVRQRKSEQAPRLHPQSLVRKLVIKSDSPHRDWLEHELLHRYNVVCCDSVEQFLLESRAITRSGQIKDPSGRHVKDDSYRIGDRSRNVLGWSNADKLRLLRDQREKLGSKIAILEQKIDKFQQQRDEIDGRLDTLSQIKVYRNYSEIDWMSLASQIAELTEERLRLERSSNILHELERKLKTVRQRVLALVRNKEEAQGRQGEVREEHKQAQKQKTRADEIWTEGPLNDSHFERLNGWRSESIGTQEITIDSCDTYEQQLRKWLQERIDAENKRLTVLAERIIKAMSSFKENFKAESVEVDPSLAALPEYARMLAVLQNDDLPRFEASFKELLNVNTINEIANFHAQLIRERETINERVDIINRSLHAIDYNPARYIKLVLSQSLDFEIQDFLKDLRACTDGAMTGSGDEQYSEAKFLQVKAILDRFRGRESFTDVDQRWTDKVTDVRNWFVFSASERYRDNEVEHEYYSDSDGKSGGQKEKLAYTVLAASLAYQFGLEMGVTQSRSFRFVVIDEAFVRGSDVSTQYGLRLFQQLNLQLLIVTPLQKIHVIEPYVSSVGYVHIENGKDSRIRCLSIDEYRANKSRPPPAST